MVVLLMANGITFPPAEPDKERYTPEQLYTYLVFADNYVKSKNISDDEFDPKIHHLTYLMLTIQMIWKY